MKGCILPSKTLSSALEEHQEKTFSSDQHSHVTKETRRDSHLSADINKCMGRMAQECLDLGQFERCQLDRTDWQGLHTHSRGRPSLADLTARVSAKVSE